LSQAKYIERRSTGVEEDKETNRVGVDKGRDFGVGLEKYKYVACARDRSTSEVAVASAVFVGIGVLFAAIDWRRISKGSEVMASVDPIVNLLNY
jgi:hypothetical protein